MPKIRITVSASWEEEVDHQTLVERREPGANLDDVFDQYKESRQRDLVDNPDLILDYVDPTVIIEDVK